MPAEARFLEIPDRSTLAINHPAYFDQTRNLVHPGGLVKYYWRGWVMVWPDKDDQGNVTQIVLREDRGEVFSDDGDIWFPGGHSIYAEPKSEFEVWTLAKALFEASRQWLIPLPEHDVPPDEVDKWRMEGIHFQDWPTASVAVSCPGKCLLRDIPLDRYFRAAWEATDIDPRAVRINMTAALVIQMDYIRLVRNTELLKLDVPFLQALEIGDVSKQQRIAGLKQVLRDIPQTFDLAVYTTPGALKAAWPPGLPREVAA